LLIFSLLHLKIDETTQEAVIAYQLESDSRFESGWQILF